VTVPPTGKLPCSWMISGSGLLLLVSCALAEVKMMTAMNDSAKRDFRCLLLIRCGPMVARADASILALHVAGTKRGFRLLPLLGPGRDTRPKIDNRFLDSGRWRLLWLLNFLC
jgi:hypothetical protein